MAAHVHLSHDYPHSAAALWALATDYAALGEVNKPLVTFSGLPEGRCVTGQKMTVDVSLFGRLPPQPYAMEVLECDDAGYCLRSREAGAGVRSWLHRVQVTATQTGARLTDDIEIDAGWLTPLFVWWARKLYSNRHGHRLRLLSEQEGV